MIRRAMSVAAPCAAWWVFAITVLAAASARANPPTADLFNWQGPCFNCYNYALNFRGAMGDRFFAQPGGGVQIPVNCNDVKMRAIADGLRFLGNPAAGQPVPAANAGECVVALAVDPRPGFVVAPNGARYPRSDYHWYRLNGDGTWSDKPGQDAAKRFLNGITNPHDVGGGVGGRGRYTDFCGYFAYTPGQPAIQAAGPSWLRQGFSARSFFLSYTGLANPAFDLLDRFAQLLAFVPTGGPLGFAPTIPDLAYTDDVGCSLVLDADASLPGFVGLSSTPRYLRFFNDGGVDYIAAYTSLEPVSASAATYYIDDRGMGDFVCAIPSPGAAGLLAAAGLACLARRRRAA